MLNKEDRKALKKIGSSPNFPTCLQIGDKKGMGESHAAVLSNALKAHELAKVKVRCDNHAEMIEAAEFLAKATSSEIVEIRGHTALFYKYAEGKAKHLL